MTTTTPRQTGAERIRRSRRAFSLVEVMIASALAGIVMTAVISSFLFIGRASIALTNYHDMETQARNAMETFAQDVRMSDAATWNSPNSLTLRVQMDGTTVNATYSFNPTARTFSRTVGGSSTVLITNIRTFSFNAYSIDTSIVSLSPLTAAASQATKQVQISLETVRTNPGLAITTNKVISARFVLRNKQVTA